MKTAPLCAVQLLVIIFNSKCLRVFIAALEEFQTSASHPRCALAFTARWILPRCSGRILFHLFLFPAVVRLVSVLKFLRFLGGCQ